MSSEACHMSFEVCHLSSEACHMSSEMCVMSSEVCHMSSEVCHMSSEACHMLSASEQGLLLADQNETLLISTFCPMMWFYIMFLDRWELYYFRCPQASWQHNVITATSVCGELMADTHPRCRRRVHRSCWDTTGWRCHWRDPSLCHLAHLGPRCHPTHRYIPPWAHPRSPGLCQGHDLGTGTRKHWHCWVDNIIFLMNC